MTFQNKAKANVLARETDRRRFMLGLVTGGAALATGLTAAPHVARSETIYTGIIGGVALGGYDAVAYFTQDAAVEGSSDFIAAWNGAEWRFSSEANRDAFVANPAEYAPAYGGHCAWAAAENYLAHGDPEVWRIIDGRLFLNFNESINRRWLRDVQGNIARADANWPALSDS